jgi:hypothetical protein
MQNDKVICNYVNDSIIIETKVKGKTALVFKYNNVKIYKGTVIKLHAFLTTRNQLHATAALLVANCSDIHRTRSLAAKPG